MERGVGPEHLRRPWAPRLRVRQSRVRLVRLEAIGALPRRLHLLVEICRKRPLEPRFEVLRCPFRRPPETPPKAHGVREGQATPGTATGGAGGRPGGRSVREPKGQRQRPRQHPRRRDPDLGAFPEGCGQEWKGGRESVLRRQR